ncbi:MAG: 3',5'-cyclic-AMP phosphodiesterase [Gammaproteobacteria bacterium]|jgi:Icc protein
MAESGSNNPLHLVQITDLHFCAEPGDILHTRVNTDATLRQVLDVVAHNEAGADLIIATGDLAQDPVESAYGRLLPVLESACAPVVCLPGNHDDAELASSLLQGERTSTPKVISRDDWLIILLDSSVPGEPWGRLDEAELSLLEECLDRHPARHALVALHHHPVDMGSPWIDTINLRNADELFAVLDHFPQVRAVMFGHVHQHWDSTRNGVRLLGTPATCIQFKPRQERLVIDTLPPAYRWLDLYPDGRIETRVVHLQTAQRLSA